MLRAGEPAVRPPAVISTLNLDASKQGEELRNPHK